MSQYDQYSREELIQELDKQKASLGSRESGVPAPSFASHTPAKDTEELFLIAKQKELLKTVTDAQASTFWEYDIVDDKINMDFMYMDDPAEHDAVPKYKNTPLVNLDSFFATIHPDDRENIIENHVKPILNGEIDKTKITFRRLFDTKEVWLVTAMRVSQYLPNGKPWKVVCCSQDITEQIELNTKIRVIENENKLFEYAVNFSNDEIHALDVNARFVFMNKIMMNNFGFKPPISNYTLNDIDKDYDVRRWQNETMPAVRNGTLTRFDAKHNYPDGRVKRIEVQLYKVDDPKHGEIFWAFCRDIEERLRHNQRITQLNALMNTILEHAPVAFICRDLNNESRYIYFNKRAEIISGFSAEEMLNNTDEEVFANDPVILEIIKKEIRLIMERKILFNSASEYKRKDGEIRLVDEIHQHVENPEMNISLLVSILWDVTEQHQKEVELIRAKEADKLKSAFLANMSHEIRTPLNSIIGFSNLMAESTDPEEKEMFTEIINKNNELLLQLINDILDFSKIESGQLQYTIKTVDVKDICFETFKAQSLKSKPGVSVIFDDKNHEAALVSADYNRLSQVINNLVNNAVKFTDKGSVTIYYIIEEGYVTIFVRDTGIGISKEQKGLLFSRFVKLNEFKQGTGLGLSISKMIIETLGGEIGFSSEEGEGSTFWVKLPLLKQYGKK